MKNTVFFLVLLSPLTSFAQSYHGMDEAEMQKLLQDMEKNLGSCMENVDEEKMKEFEQRSQEFEKEVKALCAAGKRDEAEKKAVAYGKEMEDDPTMKQIEKCSKMMDSMLSKMDYNLKDADIEDSHVCD
jgi:hypothetical protein